MTDQHPVSLYPLRFEPVFRQYLWGGRRLGTALGKPIGPEPHYAESWEVVDHGVDQSVVAGGPLAGSTLANVRQRFPRQLLGGSDPGRFPLLMKFLDCQQSLSVQVHPNDEMAARLDPPDLGKTEAWYILAAEPGSLVYVGLKRGFDRRAVEREVTRGTVHLCLHSFEPQVGDTVFVRAGVVHALGAGLLVAEIQQSSDTTYRLFDWNRVDDQGQPRPLHVAQALDAIDFNAQPVDAIQPSATDRDYAQQLVACDKFVWERWSLQEPLTLAAKGRFKILSVVAGQVRVAGDPLGTPLGLGQTALIPACWESLTLTPDPSVQMLVAHLP